MAELAPANLFPSATIVGPGAVGTMLAVRLATSGCRVTVLDHRHDRAQRIARDGLRLATDEGILTAAVAATTDPEALSPEGLVIVCVKCPALEAAGRSLASLAGPATIVTIQNGLGVREALEHGMGPAAAAQHTLVAAVTYQAASPAPDGTVRHVANLPTLLDGAGPLRPAAQRAAATFRRAGVPAQVEDDLRPAIWLKAVVNAAINPPTALARVPNGALAERPDLRKQMLSLAREAAAVARAEGVPIDDAEAERAALEAARATADNVSSMRQDVEAARPTEIDFLGAALLRLAETHGLCLPETQRVTDAIRNLSRPGS